MNILLDELPTQVEIGGVDYPMHTDFRTAIQFELAMLDPTFSQTEKAMIAVRLFFDQWPDDLETALDAVVSFYRCERPLENPNPNSETGKSRSRAYSFAHDGPYIYAAFLEQYGLDLATVQLHWWKFKALFDSLSPDTLFQKIVQWRMTPIDAQLPQEERKRLYALKEYYALPVQHTEDAKMQEIYTVLMGDGDLRQLPVQNDAETPLQTAGVKD